MNTILETMAEAYWTQSDLMHWDGRVAAMRAALLALSECELDDMMIDCAPGMIWGTNGDLINMATNNFRSILKAIAGEAA